MLLEEREGEGEREVAIRCEGGPASEGGWKEHNVFQTSFFFVSVLVWSGPVLTGVSISGATAYLNSRLPTESSSTTVSLITISDPLRGLTTEFEAVL